jgi:hypothetical protein
MQVGIKRRRVTRRGLGTVSTQVAGSLVFGSDPVARTGIPARSPISNLRYPAWGVDYIATPRQWIPVARPIGPTGILTPAPGTISPGLDPLTLAQQTLQNNPSALTATQWQLLQNAGLVPGTLPYSSASLVGSGTSTAIDPATGIPYSQEVASAAPASTFDISAALQNTYAGLPLFVWLLIAGGGYFFLSGGKGRR